MATRYINATIGVKQGESYAVTTAHSSASAGHVSVAYDDTQVMSLTKLKQALDALYRQAQSSSFFTP